MAPRAPPGPPGPYPGPMVLSQPHCLGRSQSAPRRTWTPPCGVSVFDTFFLEIKSLSKMLTFKFWRGLWECDFLASKNEHRPHQIRLISTCDSLFQDPNSTTPHFFFTHRQLSETFSSSLLRFGENLEQHKSLFIKNWGTRFLLRAKCLTCSA